MWQAKYGGKKCGVLKSTAACNTKPCPVACTVSSWGGWGGCSKACGTGGQKRSRRVTRKAKYGGKKCPKVGRKHVGMLVDVYIPAVTDIWARVRV